MPVATIAADVTAAIAAHVAASNPHSQYLLASGVSVFGASLIDDVDASTARTTLGLGTAATLAVGTSAGNVVQLDGSARLPAVDGSQLTGITASASPGGSDTQLQYNNAGTLAGASGITRTGSGVLQLSTALVAPVWRPPSDSTSALQLQTAGGTAVVTVDTTNSRVIASGYVSAPEYYISSNRAVWIDGDNNVVLGNTNLVPKTTASSNVVFGVQALNLATSATNNTAIGYTALRALNTGAGNIAIGATSMYSATSAANSVAIGLNALRSVTTNNGNTAIGKDALFSTTGANNTGIGSGTLYVNTTGANNVAIGLNAGRGTSGATDNSVFVGRDAGNGFSGSGAVMLGYSAGRNETTDNRLHIANTNSKSLILGDFSNNTLAIGFTDLTVGTAAGHFAPSTTSRSSIRVQSGVAPTSPNDGDLWFNGTNYQVRVGGTTYNLDMTPA